MNEEAFDVLTEEAAYWLGFLMADGCVHFDKSKNRWQLSLGLSPTDLEHVEAFRDFLGSNKPIRMRKPRLNRFPTGYGASTGCASFLVSSKRLVDAVAKYGVVPRKTFTARAIGVEFNPHFWRGMIDGDGCIDETSKGVRINLVGSYSIISQFRDFVKSVSPTCQATVLPQKNIYRFFVNNSHAKKVAEVCYRDCRIVLRRKYEKALSIMETPSRSKSSQYRGVCWDKAQNKWMVYINRRRLGFFRNEEEAARAYDEKALELFGRTFNFPN